MSSGYVRTINIAGVAVFIVILVLGLYHLVYMYDYGYVHGDEGLALSTAWRIYEGQIPVKDYFLSLPPFSYFPTVLMFHVLGVNFFAERILTAIYAILLVFASERLLNQYTNSTIAKCVLVSFLVPYGVLYWPFPSHHWLISILQLISLLFMAKGLTKKSLLTGFFSGICASLAAFTMQDQGAYLIIALLFIFFPFIKDNIFRKKLLISWMSGIAVVVFAFCFYMLPHVSLSDLFYEFVIFPITRYKSAYWNEASFTDFGVNLIGTSAWAKIFTTDPLYGIAFAIFAIIIAVIPFVATIVLFMAYLKRWDSSEKLGLLCAGVIAFIGGCLHRFSQTYIILAAPMLIVAISWALGRMLEHRLMFNRMLSLAIIMLVVFSGIVFPARVLGRINEDGKVLIHGSGGTIYVSAKGKDKLIQATIDLIENKVGANDYLFCTGYNSIYNFWTQRKNPTKFDGFAYPEWNTKEQLDELIVALEKNKNTFILLSPPIDENSDFYRYLTVNYRVVGELPWAFLLAPKI